MENNICIIGNSHISQFDSENLDNIYGYGASIFGLLNENSHLKLKDQILEYQKINPHKIFIFFLGQTDIEFIYYYKCVLQNKKIDIKLYIDDLIRKYIFFVKTYITNDFIFLGINPHVIKDINHIFNINFRNPENGDINGEYKSDINFTDYEYIYNSTYEDRFKYNLDFNENLKNECIKNNIKFCDLTKYILNNNYEVKKEYMPIIDDHHLIKSKTLYMNLIHEINLFYKL